MLWYIEPEPPSIIAVMFARWRTARADVAPPSDQMQFKMAAPSDLAQPYTE